MPLMATGDSLTDINFIVVSLIIYDNLDQLPLKLPYAIIPKYINLSEPLSLLFVCNQGHLCVKTGHR